jgi:hypothetical protein
MARRRGRGGWARHPGTRRTGRRRLPSMRRRRQRGARMKRSRRGTARVFFSFFWARGPRRAAFLQ